MADFPSQGWSLVPIHKEDSAFKVLKVALRTDGRELGQGRDVVEAGDYGELALKCAWRIENPNQWKRFDLERGIVHDQLKAGHR